MGLIGESLALCKQMNGRKILVCGNHDRPAMCKPHQVHHWVDRYRTEGGFEQIVTQRNTLLTEGGALLTAFGERVAVSHYPYTGESEPGRENRYADRRPIDIGLRLLHGHVHHAWKVNGRQINVGVDAWDYRPAHIDEVVGLIRLEEAGRTN